MKLNRLFLMALAASAFFASCTSDDDSSADVPSGKYDNGVLILNQGGYLAGNASVSFLSDAFQLENNIFSAVNPTITLGDTGQDIGFNGDLAYIVLNASNKIEIVNRYTFERVGSIITGLDNPRYIAFYDGKAFVTNWGDGADTTDDYIAEINLQFNLVLSHIPVADGAEKIIASGNRLYVAHGGGYGFNNKVTVINATDNSVIKTLTVGYVPNSLDIENGKLYVMSGGVPSWSTTLPQSAGSLTVINLNDNTIANTINFTGTLHPSNLDIEDGSVYYTVNSGIYKSSITATAFPTTPLFTTAAQGAYGVYSFDVENGHIYLGDAGDYISNGKVYVHSLTGALQHTFEVGVIPAGFYFNN